MRTLIAVTAGLLLAFGFVLTSNLLGKGRISGAILFLGLWLIFCAVDYANGVKAGYSAIDELGIHILMFALPAIGAWLATRFLRW